MNGRHPHPWVFLVLILPFGVIGGFLQVAIGYLLTQAGVPVERTAALIALSVLPHTWKFVWAPIADTTLTRRRWYAIAAVLTGIGIAGMGAIPPTAAGLATLSAVVLIANLAVTFLAMSVESLLAYATPENEKGRAGGWFQAGNLGGSGLGGGLGLWMATTLPGAWMAGAILGGLCVACSFALLAVPEPAPMMGHGNSRAGLAHVWKDIRETAARRMGAIALILCFLPIGSGAASGLWGAVAKDWNASANTVATVTGVLGGIVSALGCLVGGWICDRMNRKGAYALFGILQGLCAIGMGLAPRTELTFVVFTTTYAFIMGLTYAGFTAFVLEAMGLGAAATKYNLFASLSNMPIWMVTQVDGWAHARFGPSGMLYGEAILGAVGVLVFFTVLRVWPKGAAPPVEISTVTPASP